VIIENLKNKDGLKRLKLFFFKYQNENNNINLLEINDIVKKNIKNKSVIFLKLFHYQKQFSVVILKKANWETLTLKKRCAKIEYVYFSDESVGKKTLNYIIKFINKNFFWVQFDSGLSKPFLENLFMKSGFSVSNRYLVWKTKIKDLDRNFIERQSSLTRNFKLAKKKDIKKLQFFTKKYPFPGRFALSQKWKKHGLQLYSSWIKNSILDKKQKTFFYESNNVIHAYQTITVDKNDKKIILGPLRNSQKIPTIGSYMLINSLNYAINKKMKYVTTRSSTFNSEINSINQRLGMRIINSGVNLDFFNKNYLK
jgi:hypothetical protein